MENNKKYLSFSSIDLLCKDPKRFYREKIMWFRENEFQTYFTRGNAVHATIEKFNKTGERDLTVWLLIIHQDIAEEEKRTRQPFDPDVIQKITQEYETAIENYQDSDPVRAKSAEEFIKVDLMKNAPLGFVAKIDAIHEDSIEDYKVKDSLTNIDNDRRGDYIKYQRQGHFYMIAYEIDKGKRIEDFYIREIMTRKPDLMRCKKDTLIQLAKDKWIAEPTGTKEDMIREYNLTPQTVQKIHIKRDPAFDNIIMKQFKTAVSQYLVCEEMWEEALLYAMDKPYEDTNAYISYLSEKNQER